MVKLRCDKTNHCGQLVPQREWLLFNALKTHLDLQEPLQTLESLAFSWNNLHWDGARILPRVDRLYTSLPNHASRSSLIQQYSIREDGSRSDHCPIQASLNLEDGVRRKSKWKMNSRYLEEAMSELTQAQKERNDQLRGKLQETTRHLQI